MVYVHVYVCESINRKNSQFTINRYLQLKAVLCYCMILLSHLQSIIDVQ